MEKKSIISYFKAGWSAGALALATLPVFSQTEIDMGNRFQINKDGSYIQFKTTLAGHPVIRGSVKSYQATMFYDPKDVMSTSATIRIASEGFTTSHDKRDAELLGENFLDVEKFPAIWFQGDEIKVTEKGFDLTGVISIKNISKPLTIHVEKPTVVRRAMNNLDLMIAKGNLTLNRKDFDLGSSGRWATDAMFGEEIDVEFSFMGFSYTIDYLKAAYVKQVEGRDHAVGKVYAEVKEKGVKKGLKLVDELMKDKAYKGDNWASNLANIGWILMVDGYGEESLPFYDRALKDSPKHLPSLLRLGDAYTIAGQYDKALAHFRKERSLDARARFTHIPHMIKILDGEFELVNMK